jgi:hypothetical protein
MAYTLRGPFTDGTSPPLDEVTMNHFDEALNSQDDRIATIEARNLSDNAHTEGDPPTDYPTGQTVMKVTTGDAWVAAAGISVPDPEEPYFVTTTTWADGAAWQLLEYWANDELYYRSSHLDGDAWYGWHRIADLSPAHSPISSNTAFANFASTSHTHTRSNITDFSHASTHTNGTDDIQNATASQKGLATAAQITKLDGIETGATDDSALTDHINDTTDAHDATAISYAGGTGMSATDVESAIDELATEKANDSALTAHIDDTTDAHDATAISYAGSTNLSSTTVEAALDELDSEKLAASGYTAADVLSKLLTVDGSGSGLDADLLDGSNSSAFASSTHATSHVTGGSDVIASAVAGGNAGLMSGTDKTKLDGIESGATADQTAAEILTAIKTVDGAGSGLDADLLDGNSSAAFVLATDYEDADVLAKVKNVDGAGSGLDADLLDGNSSAFFATATGLSDHLADTSDAHDASAISYLGSTNLAATEVEAALDELDTEKASTGSVTTVQTNLDNHVNDTSDAHDASAISFSPTGTVASTDVQAAIAEVASEAAGFNLTEVEVDLGSSLRTSGNFVISGLSGLNTGDPVLVRQAVGPYTNKGTLADEFEMDTVNVAGKVASASTIQCYWSTDSVVRGNFKFLYVVG